MDVCRYGDYATLAYTNARVRENYSRRFSIRYPNEELPGARPLLTTPIYDRLKAAGAVFGAYYGLETPLWFAPEGVEDKFSWRRSTDFEAVGREAKAVRESVGLMETSGFAKYSIGGEGAREWLDHLLACKIPPAGRMTLAPPMLNEAGKLIGDFTLANLDDEEFLLIGSGIAEDYHMRWFESLLPEDGSVTVNALNLGLVGLSIAGPKARDVLAKLTHLDVSNEAFPFMDIREMDLGMAPAIVGRVSLYRRSRLRDLDEAGIPALSVRGDHDGGRRVRHLAVRSARRSTRCASKRGSAAGRANIVRSTVRWRPGFPVSSRFPRMSTSSARRGQPAKRRRAARCGFAPSSSTPATPT